MIKKSIILLFIIFILHSTNFYSQEYLQKYYPEKDPFVLQKLEKWQDIKFGLLMHWGPYSQWGVVESWSICAEDEDWCRRKIPNYDEYKRQYTELPKTFNPVKFAPAKWAKAAKEAGMRYVVFTTKHHDGFCMFDTKFTNYKITSPDCPFSLSSKANIAKEVFNAFRNEDFMIGAYFSKPDWHCEYYWWPNFATPDRNVNYDIPKYPDRWKKYVEFTHNQILELMTDYGRMDILWMDGGWVQKHSAELIKQYYLEHPDSGKRLINQDIDIAGLVKKAREKQPGLIVVDRAVEGPFQNYLTPENQVPGKLLPYPWESCIIMGGGWSYTFDAQYKNGNELVHLLVDIVSKGGNLLLNIAPSPEGTWDETAYASLKQLGEWMKINSEAIYESRPFMPYRVENICFTKHKSNGNVYAIYLSKENETNPPEIIELKGIDIKPNSHVTLLGCSDEIQWKKEKQGFSISIPEKFRQTPPCGYAWVIRISEQGNSREKK